MSLQGDAKDSSGFSWANVGWFILSFLIWPVGLVLNIVWWHSRHSNAKACLWGWICGLVVPILGSFLFGAIATFNLI